MAYVVRRPGGRWEVRESVATKRGPRARTLASFRRFTPAVVQRAVSAASRPLSPDQVSEAARRAGATSLAADTAARELLAEIAGGRPPSPGLRRALLDWLSDPPGNDPPGGGVAEWLEATDEERGAALVDLLGLVDAVPVLRPRPALRFPPLRHHARADA